MVKVSVIIPNYNYGRFLADALDSVLAQTHPPHEIIVVDDGSTDDSLIVAGRYGVRVQVLQQKNQGVGAARNAGVAAATGELVAFLDADDYWSPDKLALQVARYQAKPSVGLIHCGARYVDTTGATLSEDVTGLEGWVAEDLLRIRPVIVAPGSSAVLPRAVFEALGGFRSEQELPAAEDWEFCFRLAARYEIAFVPQPLLYYRQHGVSRHRNIRAMEQAMLQGFRTAFADQPALRPLQNECYARLYMVLAGSYFSAGQYGAFLRNAGQSIWRQPREIAYLMQFPQRWWQRRFSATGKLKLEQGIGQS